MERKLSIAVIDVKQPGADMKFKYANHSNTPETKQKTFLAEYDVCEGFQKKEKRTLIKLS